MALISNKKEEVTVEATNLLLDTGWVNSRGDSTTSQLHTFSYDEDTVVYVYRRLHKGTSGYATFDQLECELNNSFDSSSYEAMFYNWVALNTADYVLSSTNTPASATTYISYPNFNVATTTTFRGAVRGTQLSAGQNWRVTRMSTINSTKAVSYRIIIKKSTPASFEHTDF